LKEKKQMFKHPVGQAAIGLALLAVLVLGVFWAAPRYGVYSQRLEGEAELAKADYSKRVTVQEAMAKKDSAVLLAEAEVTRAEGVAKANKIIGDSLKGNEAYLRYLWISEMKETKDQLIYIPTEANMPILEAGRRVPTPIP
jgi:hypothetical protein